MMKWRDISLVDQEKKIEIVMVKGLEDSCDNLLNKIIDDCKGAKTLYW